MAIQELETSATNPVSVSLEGLDLELASAIALEIKNRLQAGSSFAPDQIIKDVFNQAFYSQAFGITHSYPLITDADRRKFFEEKVFEKLRGEELAKPLSVEISPKLIDDLEVAQSIAQKIINRTKNIATKMQYRQLFQAVYKDIFHKKKSSMRDQVMVVLSLNQEH